MVVLFCNKCYNGKENNGKGVLLQIRRIL